MSKIKVESKHLATKRLKTVQLLDKSDYLTYNVEVSGFSALGSEIK